MMYSTYTAVSAFCSHDQLLVADMTKIKAKGIGQKKTGGKEKGDNIDAIFSQYIEKLNKDIMRSTDHLGNSMDFMVPDCK